MVVISYRLLPLLCPILAKLCVWTRAVYLTQKGIRVEKMRVHFLRTIFSKNTLLRQPKCNIITPSRYYYTTITPLYYHSETNHPLLSLTIIYLVQCLLQSFVAILTYYGTPVNFDDILLETG